MCLRLAEMEADMRSMGGHLALVPLPHLHCILNPGSPRMGLELGTSPATKDILSLDAFQDFVEVYDGIVQTLVESGVSSGLVMRYWETNQLSMMELVGDRVLHRIDDRYHMPARGHALLASVVLEEILEKGLLNLRISATVVPDSDVFADLEYWIFLGACLALYLFVPARGRAGFLLLASYVFYLQRNAEHGLLLAISTVLDYSLAIGMGASEIRVDASCS